MRGTTGKLLAASALLASLVLASCYIGSRYAVATQVPAPANALGAQFAADPGDGWMLFGGFLMLVALSLALAGAMLWGRERKQTG